MQSLHLQNDTGGFSFKLHLLSRGGLRSVAAEEQGNAAEAVQLYEQAERFLPGSMVRTG